MKQIKLALAQNYEVALVLRHSGLTIDGKPALGLDPAREEKQQS